MEIKKIGRHAIAFEAGIVPAVLPNYAITNIGITVAEKVGDIYWIPKNTDFVISADITDTDSSGLILTDGTVSKLMVMAERLVDDISAGDDIRMIAEIADIGDGLKLILNCNFETTGNYKIDVNRLNRGLERINKGYRVAMDPSFLEFDSHLPEVI